MLKKINICKRFLVKVFLIVSLASCFLFGQEAADSSSPKYDTGFSLFTYGKYQRFSLSPMISIWKFNFEFDIELFLDLEKNDIAWEKTFDTRSTKTILDSIFRKIRYFGFSTMREVVDGNDVFHIGIGALENLTLGTGILVSRFRNTYRYPMEKNLGLTLAFNSQTEFKIGFEAFTYNFKDLMASSSGILGGARIFVNPIKFIQVGVGGVIDSNQLAGLQDTDEDGYPDDAEFFPNDSDRFSQQDKIKEDLKNQGFSDSAIDVLIKSKSDYIQVFKGERARDLFGAVSADVKFYLQEFIPIPMMLYSHAAVLVDDDDVSLNTNLNKKAEGFGIGIGTSASIGNNFRFSLEYRYSQKNFKFSYFDDYYDVNRAQISDNLPITGDNLLVNDKDANGGLGRLYFNIFDIAVLTSDYEILIGSDNEIRQRLSASLKMSKIFEKLPVISMVEGFYKNNNLNKIEDLYKDNRFLYYGYRIGINPGGLDMSYVYLVDWIEDKEGNLSKNPVFKIEIGKSY